MFVVNLLILALVVWALIDCVFRPAAAFPAIERQTKVAWLTFLGIATVVVFLRRDLTDRDARRRRRCLLPGRCANQGLGDYPPLAGLPALIGHCFAASAAASGSR